MPIKYHQWQGRIDQEGGIEGQRLHQLIAPASDSELKRNGISVIGLASDLGVERNQGRIGAQQGPTELRNAMANVAWHLGTDIYDAGDVQLDLQTEDPLAMAQLTYAVQVSELLENRQRVLGLGGGHEIAWGSYQGYRAFLDAIGERDANIGIINFDAHFDLRKPPEDVDWVGSSGTPFYQIAQYCQHRGLRFNYACLGISESSNTGALFQTAEELGVSYLLDYQCLPEHSERFINQFVTGFDYLYVTVCLDSLPAAVAPGVSAPAALGISLEFIIQALQQIQHASQRSGVTWLLTDIAELNPNYDIDHRTAKVAARLAYEIIKLKQP